MTDKLVIREKCPGGCGADCLGQLWHSHNRVFEDLSCATCAINWGRIDKGDWIILGSTSDKGLLLSRKPHGATEVKNISKGG